MKVDTLQAEQMHLGRLDSLRVQCHLHHSHQLGQIVETLLGHRDTAKEQNDDQSGTLGEDYENMKSDHESGQHKGQP